MMGFHSLVGGGGGRRLESARRWGGRACPRHWRTTAPPPRSTPPNAPPGSTTPIRQPGRRLAGGQAGGVLSRRRWAHPHPPSSPANVGAPAQVPMQRPQRGWSSNFHNNEQSRKKNQEGGIGEQPHAGGRPPGQPVDTRYGLNTPPSGGGRRGGRPPPSPLHPRARRLAPPYSAAASLEVTAPIVNNRIKLHNPRPHPHH